MTRNQEQEESATESRYQRQASLLSHQGWDQSKLSNATVAVVGNDCLAQYAALTLTAFGFGHIEIYGKGVVDNTLLANHKRIERDNGLNNNQNKSLNFSEGFMHYESRVGQTKSGSLEAILHKINPEIDITGINLSMERSENCEILSKPNVIVEATNNPASKIAVFEYADRNKIPVVSMSVSAKKGAVGIYNPQKRIAADLYENLLFYDLKEKNNSQNPAISQVIAGIGIEEARKIINPMKDEQVIDDIVVYNRESDKRFDNNNHNREKNIAPYVDLKDYSVCLIGAGALGNFASLALTLSNIGKLTIVDYDTAEIHNLNRQILLYEGVGIEKCVALADKLKAINPRGNYVARAEKITPDSDEFFKKGKFDLILDTVDNNQTRALLNYFSLKYEIPFISGGTRYNSGQANICVPKESACLNCQADIDNLALGNIARERQSCIYAAQPSVITSNEITGGLMALESMSVLDPKKYGDFARGELKFVSNEEYRLALLPAAKSNCECYNDKKKIGNWLTKMKEVYKNEPRR